jgi:hypothetical protein
MLRGEDIQAGEQAFLDPITQVSFYNCVLRSNNAPATCQFIPESSSSDGFMAECMAYNDIPLPYFLKTYGFSRAEYQGDGNYLLVLTEPVEFNLAFDLQKRMTEGRRYSEEEIKVITKICIEGVAALWKSTQLTNVGHGNLTPSSVFMTKKGTYKLGTFNRALAFKKEQTPYACYLHPRTGKGELEIINADFFAIGMIIYQLSALNNQAVPTLNTSKVNTRSQWRSFNYTDGRLEEIWMELIETNKTTSSTDRIFKLANILKTFPQSQSSSSITAPLAPPRDLQPPSLISQLVHWELNMRTPHWSRPSY